MVVEDDGDRAAAGTGPSGVVPRTAARPRGRAVGRPWRFGLTIAVGYTAIALGGAALGMLGGALTPAIAAWIVVTVDLPAVLGLARGQRHGPADGGRRGPGMPVTLAVWLVACGLSAGIGTIGITLYAKNIWSIDVTRTMALVTLTLFHVWLALETVLPRRSLLSPQLRDHRLLLGLMGASVVALALAVGFAPLAGVLGTTTLSLDQWPMGVAVSLSVVILAESKKLLGLALRGEADSKSPARTSLV